MSGQTQLYEPAKLTWGGSYWLIVHRHIEYARFKSSEKDNAVDFCNGFNAGLNVGRREH